MSKAATWISGEHRTELIGDAIHAMVVVVVLVCTVGLALAHAVSNDVVGPVLVGSLAYAAGRSGTGNGHEKERIKEVNNKVP